MEELPKYYTNLFNGVSDAIEALQHFDYEEALAVLIQAQQDAEELYIDAEEETNTFD